MRLEQNSYVRKIFLCLKSLLQTRLRIRPSDCWIMRKVYPSMDNLRGDELDKRYQLFSSTTKVGWFVIWFPQCMSHEEYAFPSSGGVPSLFSGFVLVLVMFVAIFPPARPDAESATHCPLCCCPHPTCLSQSWSHSVAMLLPFEISMHLSARTLFDTVFKFPR